MILLSTVLQRIIYWNRFETSTTANQQGAIEMFGVYLAPLHDSD